MDRYGGLVWSLARRFLYSSNEAEDAVQEIFLDLWKHAGRFDPNVAAEATYVAMIARRRLIDRVRKRTRRGNRPVQLDEEAINSPAREGTDTGSLTEDAQRAAVALERLSPQQQRVLRLSIMHGLSHEKIAAATDLPLGTVKTHARRGLIRVRQLLAEQAEQADDNVECST